MAGDILMGVNRGRNFRDTAVLYRMNAQSNALEYAMKRNGIPYKVVGGMKFFDRAEVKDMLAYLCVLNNPLDDLRLRRIINNPPRGIGATTLDKVGALAESQGASLYEIIRNADLFPELKASSAKLLKFADLIDGLRRAGTELAPAGLLRRRLRPDRLCKGPGGEERHGEPGPHRERSGAEIQHPGLPGAAAGGRHPSPAS